LELSAPVLTLALASRLLPGSRLVGDGRTPIAAAGIDTRTLAPGELFVALRGEARDGHDFASAALRAGAGALLVERELDLAVPQLVVADTREALAALGAAWRAGFDLPVACITGSNGKTTVTQMIASILARAFPPSPPSPASEGGPALVSGYLATRGNRNNSLGLPLMLLELQPGHRAAVFELGMNHAGEIAPLARWARPTVALVNNAQREHQEFMDSVQATAHENGAVIAALPASGCAVFPADDACAPVWRALAGTRRVLDFALEGPAAVTARFDCGPRSSAVAMRTPKGDIETTIGVSGVHNVRNALAATAVSLALGAGLAAIREGLAAFRAVKGRGTRRAGWAGAELVDDTYNANPDSVRAAISNLAAQGGWRLLVLGDMAETGREAIALHREVGAWAREQGVDAFFATGELAREACNAWGEGARHFPDIATLVEAARTELTARGGAATVLVKGSRSMRMERVVEGIAQGNAQRTVPDA
jgi:UDP-N-acetylmuramoyl-tripeptide--D-alanyl-D-alanine ligase